LPYFSASYKYGIIRNAEIELYSDTPKNLGHQLEVNDCNDCICNAFSKSEVHLFTCNRTIPNNFTCQFYDGMPTRDEIKSPRNDIDIYIMKENPKFEDDCCNTTFLIKILNKTLRESNFINESLRSLAFNEKNNTIITSISSNSTQNTKKKLLIFDRSNLRLVYNESDIDSIKTVGYNDGRYYLGKEGGNIEVYDETFKSPIHTINLYDGDPLTIRFLDENQMLVGTSKSGYICERNDNTENFTNCTPITGTKNSGQVHAFGPVNQSAFYVGWASNKGYLHLYTKDNKTWTQSGNYITYGDKTSDIVIDDCKRIWIVKEGKKEIIIYDQKIKNPIETLTINSEKLFNLMIFENYTLVMSHEMLDGLSRIRPPLNCRRPPL
jgi:hypothetical protein